MLTINSFKHHPKLIKIKKLQNIKRVQKGSEPYPITIAVKKKSCHLKK